VRCLERNDVDEEVEAVGDADRPLVFAVEGDVTEDAAVALVPSRDGDLPAVVGQRLRDSAADTARAAEDECVSCDLRRATRRRSRRR
jgi:hypothetical protein